MVASCEIPTMKNKRICVTTFALFFFGQSTQSVKQLLLFSSLLEFSRLCEKKHDNAFSNFHVDTADSHPIKSLHFGTARKKLRCRYTSGRTHLTPWGNAGYQFVKIGNVLATRVVLMCVLAVVGGLRFLVEQPSGSFLEELPCYQWLWGTLKVANTFCSFDHSSPHPPKKKTLHYCCEKME